MPSSPEATVRRWQPQPFEAVTAPSAGAASPAGPVASPQVSGVAFPPFEVRAPATPSLRAFEVSATVGIPEHLLAAATAAARAGGYADGWAAGLAEARAATADRLQREERAAADAAAERDARYAQAVTALSEAAATLERQATPASRDIEEQILTAAWTVASAIIGRTLSDDDVRSRDALDRALALTPADEDVTVRVSPDDFATLAAAGTSDDTAGGPPSGAASHPAADPAVLRRRRGLREITVIPDPSLPPGDAVATCGATTIDARLSAALDRVRAVLAP